MDPDASMVQGRRRPPPSPIQSGHCHHDGILDGAVTERPTVGKANLRGGAAVSGGGLHTRGKGYCLGGAQALPKTLGQPVGYESRTSPPVADFCNLG